MSSRNTGRAKCKNIAETISRMDERDIAACFKHLERRFKQRAKEQPTMTATWQTVSHQCHGIADALEHVPKVKSMPLIS